MGEVLADGASGALDRNFPCFHCAHNCNPTKEQQDGYRTICETEIVLGTHVPSSGI
jgi:hypothetical protein